MLRPDLTLQVRTKLLNAKTAMKDYILRQQKIHVIHAILMYIKESWELIASDVIRHKHGGLPIWYSVINKRDFHCLVHMLQRHANRVTRELPTSNILVRRQHVSDVMRQIIKMHRIQIILLQASLRTVLSVTKSLHQDGEGVLITHSHRFH
jgi:hypothetical protein